VKKFVQVSPIHCKLHWHSSHKFVLEQSATANPNQKIPKPYRTFAWLCKNHVKIGTLDASSFQQWNYLDACLLSYILEQCDLSELIEVEVNFRYFDENPQTYDSFLATEAGIPGKVVDRIMDQVRINECNRIEALRRFFQVLGDRASNVLELSYRGVVTAAGGGCDLGLVSSCLLRFPLQNLNLDLKHFNESPLSQQDFDILTEAIESSSALESLCLRTKGDCCIRSKSLRRLTYRGQNELIQCECPLLENMELDITGPSTPRLLSSFSHSIKTLWINFNSNESVQSSERLTEIIRAMPLLEELTLCDNYFGDDTPDTFIQIKSQSLRRLKLSFYPYIYLSSCICPNLEMIEGVFNDPMKTCPLIPRDVRQFRELIFPWDDKSDEKVFTFRDCPFIRCEVPDGCFITLRHENYEEYDE
jgi:hypothetical protein